MISVHNSNQQGKIFPSDTMSLVYLQGICDNTSDCKHVVNLKKKTYLTCVYLLSFVETGYRVGNDSFDRATV